MDTNANPFTREKRRYGYGERELRLLEACRAFPPNFDTINAIIDEGANLNAKNEGDGENNLLSDIILNYGDQLGMNGVRLPEIVKLFLERGFDVSLDEGRYGAMCLINLLHSSDDDYIIEAAKLLLAAGANPDIPSSVKDEDNVTKWAYTEGAIAESFFHNYDRAALMDTLAMMYDMKG